MTRLTRVRAGVVTGSTVLLTLAIFGLESRFAVEVSVLGVGLAFVFRWWLVRVDAIDRGVSMFYPIVVAAGFLSGYVWWLAFMVLMQAQESWDDPDVRRRPEGEKGSPEAERAEELQAVRGARRSPLIFGPIIAGVLFGPARLSDDPEPWLYVSGICTVLMALMALIGNYRARALWEFGAPVGGLIIFASIATGEASRGWPDWVGVGFFLITLCVLVFVRADQHLGELEAAPLPEERVVNMPRPQPTGELAVFRGADGIIRHPLLTADPDAEALKSIQSRLEAARQRLAEFREAGNAQGIVGLFEPAYRWHAVEDELLGDDRISDRGYWQAVFELRDDPTVSEPEDWAPILENHRDPTAIHDEADDELLRSLRRGPFRVFRRQSDRPFEFALAGHGSARTGCGADLLAVRSAKGTVLFRPSRVRGARS